MRPPFITVELVGRSAGEEPGAVVAVDEQLARAQLPERRRDRGAPAAHELTEQLVGESESKHDAPRGDVTPALGEMPEQHEQARLGGRELEQRLVDGHPVGAAPGTLEQRGGDLGPVHEALAEVVVQHRHLRRRERVPEHLVREKTVLAQGNPRLEQVALAEQLGRDVAGEQQVAGHEALDDQEAECAARLVVARDLEDARLEHLHRRDERVARARDLRCRHAQAELGIDFENSDTTGTPHSTDDPNALLRGCNPTLRSNVGNQHRRYWDRFDGRNLRMGGPPRVSSRKAVSAICLAIPGQIIDVVDDQNRLAQVDVAGVHRNVNIGLLDGDGGVGPGDWVLIHVGFAISQVDEEEARATRELLERMGEDYEQELEELKASVIE